MLRVHCTGSKGSDGLGIAAHVYFNISIIIYSICSWVPEGEPIQNRPYTELRTSANYVINIIIAPVP
jgi:hypothetical protein